MTYHLVGPNRGLCFQLCAIANLQRSGATTREEVRDLFPRQILLLLQIYEQLIILGCELELGTPRSESRWRHTILPDHAGWSLVLWSRRIKALHLMRWRLIWQSMVMMVRGEWRRVTWLVQSRLRLSMATVRCEVDRQVVSRISDSSNTRQPVKV
jgi:hypothetical protein